MVKPERFIMIVCTMDLKRSKSYSKEKRKLIQEFFINLIDQLRNFHDEILVNMTTGDEIEIVFPSPSLLFQIIHFIDNQFHFDYHMGIGIGEIEGLDNENSPTRMYGDAFYFSRGAIDNAKRKNEKILFNIEDQAKNELVNALISLINHIKQSWTEKQQNVAYYMFTHEDAFNKDAALHFGISPQAISQNLIKSGYDSVRNGEIIIMEILEDH